MCSPHECDDCLSSFLIVQRTFDFSTIITVSLILHGQSMHWERRNGCDEKGFMAEAFSIKRTIGCLDAHIIISIRSGHFKAQIELWRTWCMPSAFIQSHHKDWALGKFKKHWPSSCWSFTCKQFASLDNTKAMKFARLYHRRSIWLRVI